MNYKGFISWRTYHVNLAAWGRGVSVEVLDWFTLAGLGVAQFESCASQKCCATTWIGLTHPRVPHTMSSFGG